MSSTRTLNVIALASILTLALAACASKNEKAATPEETYKEAKEELSSGGFDKAIVLLDKVQATAAGTSLAEQAELDKAYAHYKNLENPQALATIDRFIKLYPSSPALDYALYLKGTINFADNTGLLGKWSTQDLAERDQRASRLSFEAYRQLLEQFPNSRYAPDARQRMVYIVNSLAQSEVNIARYYYARGAYVAAINRAQAAISEYRDAPALEEAMGILVRSYDALGLTQLRDDAERVMQKSFPNSGAGKPGFSASQKPWWKLW